MPNIEIHRPLGPSENALNFEEEIWNRLKKLEPSLLKDVVVSHHNTLCRDAEGSSQPYIRISCTSQEEIDKLVNALKGLADLEMLHLQGFIPQKEGK